MRFRSPGLRCLAPALLLLGACGALAALALAASGPGWTPAQAIGAGTQYQPPEVAVDDAGNATVVWIDAGKVLARTRPARSTWGPPQALDPGIVNPDAAPARVAAAPDGTVVAVWSAPTDGEGILPAQRQLRAARMLPSGAWSEPRTL